MKDIKNSDIIKKFKVDGLSCVKIAKEYGCDPETIRLRLNKNGVDTSRKIMNKDCIYCGGKTHKHGKVNGIQKYKCNTCNKTFNNETLNKIKIKNDRYTQFKSLYLDEKLSTTEIAEMVGVSSTVIQRILQSLNVTRSVKEGFYNYKYKDFDGDVQKYIKTLNNFNKYKRKVIKETEKQNIKSLPYYNFRGLNGSDGAYQLDHKFSIYEGFKENINPKIIGNINNLEFLPWEENLKKGVNCSITLKELLSNINIPEKDIKVRVKTV